MSESKFIFPVGYHTFHKDQLFNYQLNRRYSSGYARYEDMREAGKKTNNFADWKSAMPELAEKSMSEERLMNAAFYYRAGEGFDRRKIRNCQSFLRRENRHGINARSEM